jgi:hypothetical protein
MGAGWGFNDQVQALGNLDWRANLSNHQRVPNWAAAPIKVHIGFQDIYGSVQTIVHQELTKLIGQHPTAAVIVTGHSLGAAQAVVCSHDLECRGICKPFCYPFCTPRVGNMHFAVDFRRRLAEDRGLLWGETGGVAYSRSINFCQSDDPVSWGAEAGFLNEMSDESARNYADDGRGMKGVIRKGLYSMRKKTSKVILFYQTPHVYKVGRTWLWQRHQYTAMQKTLIGKSLFN